MHYSAMEKALTTKFGYKTLQFLDGTIMVNQRFFKKIYDGYAFSISKRFAGVASGANVDVYLENPTGSGRDVYLAVLEVVSFGQFWVDIYRGVAVTTPGTAITPVNLNFKSTNTSVVNVEYGGTYDITGADLVHETVVPGGSQIRAVGGSAEIGESVVIPADGTENFLVRLTNQSASAEDMSIRILWWEEVV